MFVSSIHQPILASACPLVKNAVKSLTFTGRQQQFRLLCFLKAAPTTCNHHETLFEIKSIHSSGIRKYQQYTSSRYGVESEKKQKAQREKDCITLDLPEDCTSETMLRDAYIKLAKRYHPDGRTPEANAEKFRQIDTAYRNLLKEFAEIRHNQHKMEGEYGLFYEKKRKKPEEKPTEPPAEEEMDEHPDIKHTAPQHRQYLSYDGVGSGTPFQREKQFVKYRRAKAAENVMEYRVQQLSKSSGEEVWALAKDVRSSKKTKTGIGVDRLVEDLIQESMAKGDFDNLPGKGKPLKHDSSYNPYIDFTTHKLNQVLIDNGFAPEWIMMEKEIREDIRNLRKQLSFLRHRYDAVLSPNEENEWKVIYTNELQNDCDRLNKMILKFNLVVPSLHKQMMTFQLDREAKKALLTFSPEMKENFKNEANLRAQTKATMEKQSTNNNSGSFMDLLLSMFKN